MSSSLTQKFTRRAGALLAVCTLAAATLPAHAELLARDLDGEVSTAEAYYDTVLDISWLADANLDQTSKTWSEANSWASGLTLGGTDGWRLPTLVDTGAPGCSEASLAGGTDCGLNVQTISDTGVVFSEMAHLYYVTLGNLAPCSPGDAACDPYQGGWGLANTGPFVNIQDTYWTDKPDAALPENAWAFDVEHGFQGTAEKDSRRFAWAVHQGKVGSEAVVDAGMVPEPQTLALALAGLITVLVRRRRQA